MKIENYKPKSSEIVPKHLSILGSVILPEVNGPFETFPVNFLPASKGPRNDV